MPGQAQKRKDFDTRVENLSVVRLQTLKKNDHFLKDYPSRSLQPICWLKVGIWNWHTHSQAIVWTYHPYGFAMMDFHWWICNFGFAIFVCNVMFCNVGLLFLGLQCWICSFGLDCWMLRCSWPVSPLGNEISGFSSLFVRISSGKLQLN